MPLLAGQRPTLQEVARELHLSTRTLQRRLTAERAKFQQLMEEARRELAQHYLLHSSLELNETAYLRGYEDSNSLILCPGSEIRLARPELKRQVRIQLDLPHVRLQDLVESDWQ
jgi:AraC-like DNA-binding protein